VSRKDHFTHKNDLLKLSPKTTLPEESSVDPHSLFTKTQATNPEMSTVREIVESNDVVIFTWTQCPYCVKAKQLLQEKNIEYLEVLATPDHLEALEAATGQGSVPNIWVKGQFIGGCNDGPEDWMGLAKCLRSGKFQELIEG
jgi:glutaredoxin 3